MGQPTQRATNYTARSNIVTAQIFLHATRLYTHSHELPALAALAQHISHSHSGIDEKRPTEKFDICVCVCIDRVDQSCMDEPSAAVSVLPRVHIHIYHIDIDRERETHI